jgi:hypothetical protein
VKSLENTETRFNPTAKSLKGSCALALQAIDDGSAAGDPDRTAPGIRVGRSQPKCYPRGM